MSSVEVEAITQDPNPSDENPSPDPAPRMSTSPRIESIHWGQITTTVAENAKDVKLWPGGGRAWDWNETGTQHNPGIQFADVEELLEHGATVVVLSRGVYGQLRVPIDTIKEIKSRGAQVHVAETKVAVEVYNQMVDDGTAVGGLFHSTC